MVAAIPTATGSPSANRCHSSVAEPRATYPMAQRTPPIAITRRGPHRWTATPTAGADRPEARKRNEPTRVSIVREVAK